MDLWPEVLKKIRQSILKPAFDTWFSGTRAEIEEDVITVICNNEFAADWLEGHYKTLIFETVRELKNQTYEIEFSSPNKTVTSRFSHSKEHITLRNLIEEQNMIIRDQQEKMEKLEKRIEQLENLIMK